MYFSADPPPPGFPADSSPEEVMGVIVMAIFCALTSLCLFSRPNQGNGEFNELPNRVSNPSEWIVSQCSTVMATSRTNCRLSAGDRTSSPHGDGGQHRRDSDQRSHHSDCESGGSTHNHHFACSRCLFRCNGFRASFLRQFSKRFRSS